MALKNATFYDGVSLRAERNAIAGALTVPRATWFIVTLNLIKPYARANKIGDKA